VSQRIEMSATVIVKDLCIDVAVDNQENNKEKSGGTHKELTANIGGKGSFPIHKDENDVEMTAQR
jgi:hypothetical protein